MKRTFGWTSSPECAASAAAGVDESKEEEGESEEECTVQKAAKKLRLAIAAGSGRGTCAGEDPTQGMKREEETSTKSIRREDDPEGELLWDRFGASTSQENSGVRGMDDVRCRAHEGGCLVAEGYEEVLTFLGTLVNEYRLVNPTFPSAVLIGSRAAFHWDVRAVRSDREEF